MYYADEVLMVNQWDNVANISNSSSVTTRYRSGEDVLDFYNMSEVRHDKSQA